jgi:hypothetical protein
VRLTLVRVCRAPRQTAVNGTYRHNIVDLDGANVFLLQYIATAGQFNIVYDTVFLDDAMYFHDNRTEQMVYLFETLGYDCLLTSTVLRGERLAYADFLVSNEQFGLSVVTKVGVSKDYPVVDMLFAWASPFSWQIWVTVLFSLLFGSVAMFYFEGDDKLMDFGSPSLPLALRLCRGWYKAFLNFTSVGGFEATTPAGQVFNVAFSFSMLLLQAAYTANLAAYFTKTQPPVSAVNAMSDFSGRQLPACITNDPYVYDLLRSAFPLTQFVVLPSALTSDLLDAIASGQCSGGVAPDVHLRYALGPQDPLGKYCDLEVTGGLLSENYFAIPFSRGSVSRDVVNAMNSIAANAFAYGDYAVGASMASFPHARPSCEGYNSGQSANSGGSGALTALRITQVSGIFFLIFFGSILALLFYLAFIYLGLGKVDDRGSDMEEALKARQEAEMAELKAAEASGDVAGGKLSGAPVRASSATWLARIHGGGAIGTLTAASGGSYPSPNGSGGNSFAAGDGNGGGDYSKLGAVEALAAALAREAAAVMDVPARTTAGIERAITERGAYMVATLRLCDAAGNAYGPEMPTGPMMRPADWQFLYTRLRSDDAAAFNRQLRGLAAGRPAPAPPAQLFARAAADEEAGMVAWAGALGPSPSRSSGALLQEVVVRHHHHHHLGTSSLPGAALAPSPSSSMGRSSDPAARLYRRSGGAAAMGASGDASSLQRRSMRPAPLPVPPPQRVRPFAFPSLQAIGAMLGGKPAAPAAEAPRAVSAERRRRPPADIDARSGARTEERSRAAPRPAGAAATKSEPPLRGRRRQIPSFDD